MHASGSTPSPRGLRILKHKVATLLDQSFHRCRTCLKHRRVLPASKDCASVLETHLSQEEFERVLEQPGAFVSDERMRKELEVEEEPEWDYLLAHDPKEITPVHLYYKKRREEKTRKIKQQQEELELKRRSLSPKHRPSLLQYKPTIRLRPIDLFSSQFKPPPAPKRPSQQKLTLPRIGTVPLLQNSKPGHHISRSHNSSKMWLQFSAVFAQAETRHRLQVAKLADVRTKAPPTISIQESGDSAQKQRLLPRRKL